jgi:hypothetical protein
MQTETRTFMDKARETLAEHMDQHKIESMSRKDMRKRVQIRHGVNRRPFARFRSGLRTGTTPHFALWMADVNIKSALQRTSLASLADRESGDVATAYGLLYVGGFKSVYDLTRADARDLLHVSGIGPKRLELVRANLASHQVAVNW